MPYYFDRTPGGTKKLKPARRVFADENDKRAYRRTVAWSWTKVVLLTGISLAVYLWDPGWHWRWLWVGFVLLAIGRPGYVEQRDQARRIRKALDALPPQEPVRRTYPPLFKRHR
jgi:hypothetical protein